MRGVFYAKKTAKSRDRKTKITIFATKKKLHKMRTLISNAIIVNDGEQFRGSIVTNDNYITEILRGDALPHSEVDTIIEAEGMYLIPGVIDTHVHFREPGLTEKATIATESRAAAAGGVTSYMEMPNTKPQTTTIKAFNEKFAIAAKDSITNYSFYFGATNDNSSKLLSPELNKACGIKLFMGSSTGNMLVDKKEQLEKIFSTARLPIAVHCEDSDIIAKNTKKVIAEAGENPPIEYHPVIRDTEACYRSTKSAVELAKKYGSRLHIMHISTEKELSLLKKGSIGNKNITAEVTPAHLTFCSDDYARLGTKIKCNPAIKSRGDRDALRSALIDGEIDVVGTDHAPHLPKDKVGGALTAASGMPSIQFSLLTMLKLANELQIPIETIVEKMCHAPARLFGVNKRGYIKKGYFADFVLLRPNSPHTVEQKEIISKCGWSPFEGETFNWKIAQTWVNGNCVYKNGCIIEGTKGKKLTFNR